MARLSKADILRLHRFRMKWIDDALVSPFCSKRDHLESESHQAEDLIVMAPKTEKIVDARLQKSKSILTEEKVEIMDIGMIETALDQPTSPATVAKIKKKSQTKKLKQKLGIFSSVIADLKGRINTFKADWEEMNRHLAPIPSEPLPPSSWRELWTL